LSKSRRNLICPFRAQFRVFVVSDPAELNY
jgi:hypothetical protein